MNPIRHLRSQTGVTQKDLAKLAGTSQPTIAAYEAGNKSPTMETLEKLAKALGLKVMVSFVPPLTREDLRSLAYHEAIVAKLKSDPKAVLAKARRNLEVMSKKHPDASRLFEKWAEWLICPIDELINRCLDLSLMARDMRQVTPFSGILSAKERLEVLKKFKKRESNE